MTTGNTAVLALRARKPTPQKRPVPRTENGRSDPRAVDWNSGLDRKARLAGCGMRLLIFVFLSIIYALCRSERQVLFELFLAGFLVVSAGLLFLNLHDVGGQARRLAAGILDAIGLTVMSYSLGSGLPLEIAAYLLLVIFYSLIVRRRTLFVLVAVWILGYATVILVEQLYPGAHAPVMPLWARTPLRGPGQAAVHLIVFTVVLLASGRILTGLMREFRRERRKTECLLCNILPERIADRLRENLRPVAQKFDSATVLFADVVGFTSLSSRLPARELVRLLNHLFSRFDRLADRFGLEKIKTIGDAYMVAGGIPESRRDHVRAVADMALAMLETPLATGNGEPLQLRIGIHVGPVVAGVIGKKKFSYDLWGDTVNLASRMESQGLAGRIQVTREVVEILKDRYQFVERGPVEIKGRGALTTYLLEKADEPVATASVSG